MFAGGIPSEWDNDGDSFFDNINLYQNSGSITSRVFLDGLDVGSEGDALAAFVDGEQRGYVTEVLCLLLLEEVMHFYY